jgi:hypothetical protein
LLSTTVIRGKIKGNIEETGDEEEGVSISWMTFRQRKDNVN